MATIEFGKALAQEWASFPVLADCQGQHRKVRCGQSYYQGDALNKSLVEPAAVERILQKVLAIAQADPDSRPAAPPKPENDIPITPERSDQGGAGNKAGPTVAPKETLDPEKLNKPLMKSKTVWQWLLTAIGTPFAVFGGFDWRVQLAIVVIIACFPVYAIRRRNDIAKVYRKLKDQIGV